MNLEPVTQSDISQEERNKYCVSESRSVVSDSLRPHGLYTPWNSPGQNTGVGSLSVLQGIFPTQGSNPSRSLQADFVPTELSGKPHKYCILTYIYIYMESRKMVLMNLFAGQQWRCRHRGQTYGHREGEEERLGCMERVGCKERVA